MYVYFVIALMLFGVWILLFKHRKDLRFKMIISSLAVLPFAFFDYYSQPSYWHPQTFWNIPIGIEGFLAGFSFGGIASVLYEEILNKHLRKIRETKKKQFEHLIIPTIVIGISFIAFVFLKMNMMHALMTGLLAGIVFLILMGKDLFVPLLFSGIFFGFFYLIVLFIWLRMFPDAFYWWNLNIFWNITLLGIPLGEVLFGFLYGAFWGPVYEFLFGYKEVKSLTKKGRKS